MSLQKLGWARSDYVISTKIFWGGQGPNDKGLSRKHVIEGTKVQSALNSNVQTSHLTLLTGTAFGAEGG